MAKKRTAWLICVALLCIVLYTIVISRMDRQTEVIFGGKDGAYVKSDSVTFQDANAANTPEPTENIWPDIDITQEQYYIVNDDNLLSATWEPEVSKIESTSYMMFSTAAMPYLEDFIQAIKDAGFNVYVGAAYRTYSYQTKIFNGKASQLALEMFGIDDYNDPRYQEAAEAARSITAYPGSSEHQLGLAVDLMDKNYQRLVYSDMNQEFYEWVDAHCAEYGFINGI